MLRRGRLLLAVAATLLLALGCGAPPEDDPGDSDGVAELTESRAAGDVSYDGFEALEGAALKNALSALVKGHHRLGYDRARDALFRMRPFLGADGKVECNYTGRRVSPNGTRNPAGFNTEHTWPQSLGASHEPARSDLHHLFAVDDHANRVRGNLPFGTAGCLHDGSRCDYASGGSALGQDASGARVFEVREERRGNVARAMFYFSVRYALAIPDGEEATLRSWHEDDPVDDAERARNDAIQALQYNRNPFVDHPEFVARIADF